MFQLQQFHAVAFSGNSTIIPSFVSAGNGATEAGLSGTLQVPFPATVGINQFLVCHVYSADATASAISVPAGWTDIVNKDATGDTTHTSRCFYKVASGSESGNLDVTISAASVLASGRIYAFSHGSGVEAAAGLATDSSGTNMGCNNITTLGVDRLIVQLMAARSNTTIGDASGATGATYTEQVAEYANAAGVILSCQGAPVQSATAVTGGTATLGAGGTYRIRLGFAITP